MCAYKSSLCYLEEKNVRRKKNKLNPEEMDRSQRVCVKYKETGSGIYGYHIMHTEYKNEGQFERSTASDLMI